LKNATEPNSANPKGWCTKVGWMYPIPPTKNSKDSPTLFLSVSLSLSHKHTHTLSLSLSHTHTHTTHTQLARVYTNGVGAMPFCLQQKLPFLFHLLWISLKSMRINWVPGLFFFQTNLINNNAFF
jgi:hypothetical protein